MLRHKDTTILSEINNFFTSGQKATHAILTLLTTLKLSETILGISSKHNAIHANIDKFILLILFPFFEVKNACNYADSTLYPMLSCGKDAFYRLLNNSFISWRNIAYKVHLKLIRKTVKSSDPPSQPTRCLIVDDTDFVKTGKRLELIGKVFSHVTHTSMLGFKALFMGYHDGKSFFALDFSLHGEKGKNKKRPYGLSIKELKQRYTKKRPKVSPAYQRKQEYFDTKIQSMINMIRRAIKKGIRFDYLLNYLLGTGLIHLFS